MTLRTVFTKHLFFICFLSVIAVLAACDNNSPTGPKYTKTPTPGGPTFTPTKTPAAPTATPVGPTATPTNTPVGPTATRTNTPVGPTATPAAATATATATAAAPTATRTPLPATATPTSVPATATPTTVPAIVDVVMSGIKFVPQDITIHVGQTVRWTNHDPFNHTTTSGDNCVADGKWDSGALSQNGTFSHTFSSAGPNPYHCSIHCVSNNMIGSVTVIP